MNYHKIEKVSVSNGTGVRVVLWVSGCTCYCRGCHNPQTWGFNSGQPFDKNAKRELFEALNKSYVKGITFSGGHPLEDTNVSTVYQLCQEIKEKFPTKDIWLYTGYTLEEIFYPRATSDLTTERDIAIACNKRNIVEVCDVLVDGKYVEELKDLTLKWRGSKNQRVIDVKETLRQNKIVLYCD